MIKKKTAIASVVVFALGAAPAIVAAYETGTIHVNKNTAASWNPNQVRDANDHGCNDHWADFWYVPEDKLGSLGVWATDSNSQAHIDRHNGLDGWYECNGGLCNVHLCAKEGAYPYGGYNWWADAGSVRLRVP